LSRLAIADNAALLREAQLWPEWPVPERPAGCGAVASEEDEEARRRRTKWAKSCLVATLRAAIGTSQGVLAGVMMKMITRRVAAAGTFLIGMSTARTAVASFAGR